MTTKKHTIMCLGYIPTDDNQVEKYIISVVDVENNKEQILQIPPEKIASHISMKRLFLDINIIYRPTKQEHDQWLSNVFAKKMNALSPSLLS